LASALAGADKECAPANRDALIKEFMAAHGQLAHEDIVRRNREVSAGRTT
jgi:8-hydroxy-5-deazaflavin:NADPH oxidoreductase